MTFSEFKSYVKQEINLDLCGAQIDHFMRYWNMIKTYNEVMNITAISTENPAKVKHFLDSLYVLKYVNFENKTVCDVGTGLGLPGIAIAIAKPHVKVDLIESSKKKCAFLNEVKKELNLENIEVINSRVEDLKEREKYDIVLARALKPMNILLELISFLAKVNGQIIAYKGPNYNEELSKAENAIKKLDLKIESAPKYHLPIVELDRYLVIFKKLSATKAKYPRNFSLISQKPL